MTLQYEEMCHEINEVQRNLKPLFPDLVKLKINLRSDQENSCTTSDMINCPPNLKSVTINNLKDVILPKICQPQITYLDCHFCKNLKDISNVSQMENLEILKIEGANLIKLGGNFFEKNKKLKTLDLRKCKIKNVYNNSLNGLVNLEDIVLEGNPIMEIPSGKLAQAVYTVLKINLLKRKFLWSTRAPAFQIFIDKKSTILNYLSTHFLMSMQFVNAPYF